MRFIHISDVHVVSTEKECKEIYGVSTNPALKLLKSANSIKKLNPDFVVVTGDIAAMADKDYADRVVCWYLTFKEFFIRPLERSGIRVFVVPGNHDVNKAFGLDIYRMLFGEENYHIDINGIRLIFMTPKMRARKCKPSGQLIEWLKSIVKESSLIFSHYPLSQWKRHEEIVEILDGKVKGFFSGHLHKNSFTLRFGFPEVQTSALSGSWWNTWGDDGCMRVVRITNNEISSKLIKVV